MAGRGGGYFREVGFLCLAKGLLWPLKVFMGFGRGPKHSKEEKLMDLRE